MTSSKTPPHPITPLQNHVPSDDLPPEILHINSLPIAQPTLNDPSFKVQSTSRTLTHNGHAHTLMAHTWNTPTTIKNLISYSRLSPSNPNTNPNHPDPDPAPRYLDLDINLSTPHLDIDPSTRTEVRRFYTFGSGLNAHPDLLHGGVIACILDSTMGAVIGIGVVMPAGQPTADAAADMFTAQLNVKYERPVRTPGSIMVRSWVKRVEEGGRKVWVEGVVEGEEGGEVRHARAEGLWVRSGAKRKKTGRL